MSFSLIAAIGKNNELGKNNGLIFHLKKDMEFFKNTTMNHKVVMGRKTFESIGRPLPKRENIVLSRRRLILPENVKQITSVEKFIKENEQASEEIFIIGGASVYKLFLPYAKTLYLTEVEAEEKSADAFFPDFDKNGFKKEELFYQPKDEDNKQEFRIIKYSRKDD